MIVSRQKLLKLGLLSGASLVLPAGRLTQAILADAIPSSPVFPPFLRPLPLPSKLKPVRRDATTDYYAITMRPDLAQILPDPRLRTPIWGYNGLFPGPTIEVKTGRTVVVTQTNMLPEATSVHLHGAVVDGNSDGHPLDLIPPGGVKVYTYPNTEHQNPDRQSARTQWYHDHAIDVTGPQVYRGLAGFYLIRDDLEKELQLPSGPYDIPLVIQDRRFNADGSLFFPPFPDFDSENGVFGDTIVVNGVMQPFLQVEPRRYRFRVLNGSNARQYELALSSGQPLLQIATEGGLLPTPVPRSSLFIAQAERYEFIVDFTGQQGNHMVLRNLNGQNMHHNETVRVIMQWYDVPDGPVRTDGRDFKNKYVFHCHNLEHEDHMMMGEIEVRRRF